MMMLKKLMAILGLACIITSILVACGTSGSSTNVGGPRVHMNNTNFVQTSITIKKGQSVTLIDDGLTPHVITNGAWESGTARSRREQGAPEVKDVQISGYSEGSIGPFTTAGTFKLYCTIHPGMNLNVIVQ
jgi:plastocyanin